MDINIGCTRTPDLLTLPGPGRQLEPSGWYETTGFEPRLSFTVQGDVIWTTVQQFPGFFDIQDDPGSLDVVAVQFTRATGFDTAEQAAADIEARDNLLVGERKQVTVRSSNDGLRGIRLVVETTDPAHSDPVIFRPVLNTPPGPVSIGSGRRLEINLFDVNGQVLAILVGGSIAEWDRAKQHSRPVLDSVVVDDSTFG